MNVLSPHWAKGWKTGNGVSFATLRQKFTITIANIIMPIANLQVVLGWAGSLELPPSNHVLYLLLTCRHGHTHGHTRTHTHTCIYTAYTHNIYSHINRLTCTCSFWYLYLLCYDSYKNMCIISVNYLVDSRHGYRY